MDESMLWKLWMDNCGLVDDFNGGDYCLGWEVTVPMRTNTFIF